MTRQFQGTKPMGGAWRAAVRTLASTYKALVRIKVVTNFVIIH
jgi:hypothetical protein